MDSRHSPDKNSSNTYIIKNDGGVAMAKLANLPSRRFHTLFGQSPGKKKDKSCIIIKIINMISFGKQNLCLRPKLYLVVHPETGTNFTEVPIILQSWEVKETNKEGKSPFASVLLHNVFGPFHSLSFDLDQQWVTEVRLIFPLPI